MAVPKPTERRVTYEEYLRREAESPVRHEYRNGEMVAMAGGTYEHSLICSNTIRALGNLLEGKPCRVLESNMKVLIERFGQGAYPDATVICGIPQFALSGKDRTTVLNPRVLVEVLSPSTADDDRTTKFDLYCEIPSFEEYVLIDQKRPRVETRRRLPDGSWKLDAVNGIDATVTVGSIGVELSLRKLYDGVAFDTPVDDVAT